MGSTKKMLENLLSDIAFVILCAIMAYAVFWGVGNPVSIGGLSLWTILLMLFLLTSAIPLLMNLRQVLKNIYFGMLIALGIWVAFSAVYGFLRGNSLSTIIRDLSGVIYFAFFPFIFAILKQRQRVHTLMKVMMYAAFALALLQLVCFFDYLIQPEQFESVKNYFVGINYLNYTRISATIPRLLFVSMPFQVCGCAFSIYFQIKTERISIPYICTTGVCLNAIILTFTRALYLSAALAAISLIVLLLFLMHKDAATWKKLGIQIVAAVAVCILVTCVLGVVGRTNYLIYAIKRVTVALDVPINTEPTVTEPAVTEPAVTESMVTEPTVTEPVVTEPTQPFDEEANLYLQATAQSDQYRATIQQELVDLIKESPIVGNGMGIALKTKQDWPEYSYLDLMAKTGVVGLVLYLLPIFLMICTIIKDVSRKATAISVAWFAVMLGLLVYSIFQPYLNNVQCVLIYCCTLCAHAVDKKTAE